MKNWIIVGTFFCLWLATYFSAGIQAMLAFSTIATVGLLHGANDINIIRRGSDTLITNRSSLKTIGVYVITILVVIGLFMFIPVLAISLFILFSGYHFGEQHLKNKLHLSAQGSLAFYTVYGMTILTMIFYAQSQEVIPIISGFIGISLTEEFFKVLFLLFLGLTIVGLLVFRKKLKNKLWQEFFFLLVLFIVFRTASLLWGFSIYFVLWHSIPSIKDQIGFLYGKPNKESFKKYCKACWPYWIISILTLVLIYILFKGNEANLISTLITLLAAITIPHILVMSRVESNV